MHNSDVLGFTVDQKLFNAFSEMNGISESQVPPKLPPKRSVNVPSPFIDTANGQDNFNEEIGWETKNPFNPFISEEYPDFPPPSSPPPPPPPRLPTKISEPLSMSPPPPRPPSRSNGVPTPPLPKRKSPFSSASRTWFSFDQEPVAFSIASSSTEPDANNHFVPPIPSPARKLPTSGKFEPSTLKSSSASSSPATYRRLYNQNLHLSNSVLTKDVDDKNIKPNEIKSGSPHKVLSRHSSIMQENDSYVVSGFNPFTDTNSIADLTFPECTENTKILNRSPPLPPKPTTISRPRPSPSKKMLATADITSQSSSSLSVAEASDGIHSSSSLVFSSSDDNKNGSSCEALFLSSTGSQSEVFPQNILETTQQSSNNSQPEEKACELSPDSIFRRKSDPFADDFFLSLPKKSCNNASLGIKNETKQNCSNGIESHFEDLKLPVLVPCMSSIETV
ncbi:hypothetical protein X975_16876, partial [Stegodyphus mimosarum]